MYDDLKGKTVVVTGSSKAVSYTHLDVYKRQPWWWRGRT